MRRKTWYGLMLWLPMVVPCVAFTIAWMIKDAITFPPDIHATLRMIAIGVIVPILAAPSYLCFIVYIWWHYSKKYYTVQDICARSWHLPLWFIPVCAAQAAMMLQANIIYAYGLMLIAVAPAVVVYGYCYVILAHALTAIFRRFCWIKE